MISVDATFTEARTRAYLDAIASIDPQARAHADQHHRHGDHRARQLPDDGATIVGHHQVPRGDQVMPLMPPPPGIWTQVELGAPRAETAVPDLRQQRHSEFQATLH